MIIKFKNEQEDSFNKLRSSDKNGWYFSKSRTIIFKEDNKCVRFSQQVDNPHIWMNIEKLSESFQYLESKNVALHVNLNGE